MADFPNTVDPLSQRLEFRRDLVVRGETFGGRLGYVVEDPRQGKFYQLGEAECRFLRLLDGARTLQEVIACAASTECRAAFSQAEALVLVRWAAKRQLLADAAGGETAVGRRNSAEPDAEAPAALNPFFFRIPFAYPERLLSMSSRCLGGAFSIVGGVLFAAVWFGLCLYVLPRADDILRWETVWHPQNWLGLLLIWLALKAWHELGHAVACLRCGGQVRSAGVAVICFAPVAYVDVTSAWRIPSKWRRILVSVAGMYFEGWAAALAIFTAAVCHDESLRMWACHVAFVAGGQTLLVNANPLVRFDGYYILADLLELPNLHALSRQAAINALRRLTGDEQAIDAPVVGHRRRLLIGYSWAAGIWRVCLVLGGCGFFLAQRDVLGRPLCWTITLLWVALPLITMRGDLDSLQNWRPQVGRLVVIGSAVLVLLVGGGWWLLQPAVIRAEGIVEFSPITVLRAAVPGFVRQVHVRNGDYVSAGAPLVVLQNDDLEFEAIDLRLQVQQSKATIQSLSARQQLAQRSNEEANCRALETRLSELQDKLNALTLRAPHAGRIIAHEWDQLAGRFLAAGDEVAILGADDTLHVLAVISQNDLNTVQEHGRQATLLLGADSYIDVSTEAIRFQPAARMSLPHDALSGVNGGPISMRQSAEPASDGKQSFEPLAPVFIATAPLPLEHSPDYRSGERAAVRFLCSGYSRAARLRDMVRRWIYKV